LLTPQAYRRAWNFACRLAATREDAEDLFQESLAKAYRSLDRLRDPGRFCAWLMTIVRNCFLHARRRKRFEFVDSYWYRLVSDGAVEDPLAESIAEALARLPKAQHEILSLFYLDGLSLEETGWVLGVAPQVVGQRLFRARRALRRVIADPGMLGIQPQRCKQ